jgi:hypothetical protein
MSSGAVGQRFAAHLPSLAAICKEAAPHATKG